MTNDAIALEGWDKAVWRATQAEPTLVSNVVGVIECDGIVDHSVLRQRIYTVVGRNSLMRSVIKDVAGEVTAVPVRAMRVTDHVVFVRSDDNVIDVANQMAQTQLPLDKPLWKVQVVEQRGRSFIIAAFHHAVADGSAAMMMALSLLDQFHNNPQRPDSGHSSKSVGSAEAKDVVRRAMQDPQGFIRDLTQLATSAAKVLPLDSAPVVPGHRSGGFETRTFVIDSSLYRELGWGSVYATTTALMLSAHKQLSRQLGLKPTQVWCNVPVAANLTGSTANQLVVARFPLPVLQESPSEIAKRAAQLINDWREQPALALAPYVMSLVNVLPSDAIVSTLRQADLTISSVGGRLREGSIDGVNVVSVAPVVGPNGTFAAATTLRFFDSVVVSVSVDSTQPRFADMWWQAWNELLRSYGLLK
jgi:hypothetical protein